MPASANSPFYQKQYMGSKIQIYWAVCRQKAEKRSKKKNYQEMRTHEYSVALCTSEGSEEKNSTVKNRFYGSVKLEMMKLYEGK